MLLLKKLLIVSAIGAMLHIPVTSTAIAGTGATDAAPQNAGTAATDAAPSKVTENKPQISGTPEENLPGSTASTGKSPRRRLLLIGAAAVVVIGIALGLSGGGGGDSGNDPPPNDENGGVEVEW